MESNIKPNLIEENLYKQLIENQNNKLYWYLKTLNNIKTTIVENIGFFILFIILFFLLILRYLYVKDKKTKLKILV